ncbi:MAG: HU family DNA-binding protein [Candidatus Phytoplasma pruni]|nr:HU family DNA-binding protein [Candidatus Phytoplasma pruni]
MTKSDLLIAMSDKLGVNKKEVEKFLLSLNETIKKGLHEDAKIILPGLGIVRLKHRKERKCKVPKSEQVLTVPAQDVPIFKVNKKFKEIFKK